MSFSVLNKANVPIKIWSPIAEVESKALDQLTNTANLPCIFKHLAVMADVHYGKGATVGSVIATKNAIIPAAVGVDIGCGMMAAKLPIQADQLPDSLKELRVDIERWIPVGFGQHDHPRKASIEWAGWHQWPTLIPKQLLNLNNKAHRQLGTLGGEIILSSCAWMRSKPCGSCCTRVPATSAKRSQGCLLTRRRV